MKKLGLHHALIGKLYRHDAVYRTSGIYLCNTNGMPRSTYSDYIYRTEEALELIRRHDEVRFRRVTRRIRYIAFEELNGLAGYLPIGHVCSVDMSRFDFRSNHDWYIGLYAATLIHEATHGEFSARGIRYTQKSRERIERICTQQEARFVAKAKPWMVPHLRVFDPTDWADNWKNRDRFLWTLRRRQGK